MTVLDLFARDPAWLTSPQSRLERKFAEHHARHPEVWREFERFALEAFTAGASRIGAKAIAERVRWETAVNRPAVDWAVNNSYVALYARLLIHRYPEMESLIETRRRSA